MPQIILACLGLLVCILSSLYQIWAWNSMAFVRCALKGSVCWKHVVLTVRPTPTQLVNQSLESDSLCMITPCFLEVPWDNQSVRIPLAPLSFPSGPEVSIASFDTLPARSPRGWGQGASTATQNVCVTVNKKKPRMCFSSFAYKQFRKIALFWISIFIGFRERF